LASSYAADQEILFRKELSVLGTILNIFKILLECVSV